MRLSQLGAVLALTAVLPSGFVTADEVPDRVLVQPKARTGFAESVHYLWLGAERLDDELGLIPEDALALADHLQDSADPVLPTIDSWDQEQAILQMKMFQGLNLHPPVGDAELRDGLRLDRAGVDRFCERTELHTLRLSTVRREFEGQILEAKGGVVGRIVGIRHGFSFELHPAVLLVLDVEETLIFGEFSMSPYVILLSGAFVHADRVFCPLYTINDFFPEIGHRLVVLPSAGPMDEEGRFMLVTSPDELFLIEEPDRSGVQRVTPLGDSKRTVPSNLIDFRRSVERWRATGSDSGAYP